jgi:copper(I)-binding protein
MGGKMTWINLQGGDVMRLAWLLCGAALFVGVLMYRPAHAHQDEIGTIVVTHPYVEPGRSGGDTIARLRLENQGSSTRQLLGLHAEFASGSRIEVKVSPVRAVPMGSLPIRPGETLDLEDTAWIRLTGLRRDLMYGETVKGCLDFADGRKKQITLTVGQFEL